jgi:hypothetical protein
MRRYLNQHVWKTIEEVSTPPAGYSDVHVLRDMWWILNAEGKVCLYENEFAQANPDRNIALAMAKDSYLPGATGQIVQIPFAFVGHTCERR